MLPKPSLVLQVKLLPEDYSEIAAAEIKRSYMYLAQSVVSELPEGERDEGNLMRLNVRLMKPYWDPEDPAAQELWSKSFMPWLANATRNMSTAMHNFNTVLHPLGAGNVSYEWVDYDFAPNGVLRIKVDDDNRIPSEAPAFCDRVRALLSQGAFGEGVERIRIPSLASLEAQRAAFEEAERLRAQSAEATESDEAAPVEDTADAIEIEAAEDAPDAEEAVDEAAEASVAPAKFVLDYGTWGIEYADGTVKEFDFRAN